MASQLPTNASDQSPYIKQIQCWLKTIIIDLNFCPFAKREYLKNSIRYAVCDTPEKEKEKDNDSSLETGLQHLAEELQYLDQHAQTETTLLIFPHSFEEFDDFLELIELSDELIDELGYRSIYQIAHFHPEYCFDSVEQTDASNFTNRSPYPVLHLLRESSLQYVIEHHPDTAAIPETNIKLARQMGSAKLQALLENCKQKFK